MEVEYTEGAAAFLAALDEYGVLHEPGVQELVEWAQELERDGLAHLRSTIGSSSRALRVELLDEDKTLVILWRLRRGVSLGLQRSVLRRRARSSVDRIEQVVRERLTEAGGATYPQERHWERFSRH
jgi:hypothetical protein